MVYYYLSSVISILVNDYLQVSFNLNMILYEGKITRNTVTKLRTPPVTLSNHHQLLLVPLNKVIIRKFIEGALFWFNYLCFFIFFFHAILTHLHLRTLKKTIVVNSKLTRLYREVLVWTFENGPCEGAF